MVDLHIHTNASDGTDSPEELLTKIQNAGIKIFAVTDHDTIKGAMEIKKIVPSGIKFVQGVEFSCQTSKRKCHILGFNYDEKNSEFLEALKTGDDLRHQKFFSRIKLLKENFGIEFTDDEVEKLLSSPSVGKPHIANMIVEKGRASNRQEAINNFINKCKTGVDKIEARQAVKAILSSGGIPVWAHPLGGEGERELSEGEFSETLEELRSFGLKGLECWYSKYSVKKCERLVEVAKISGLLVSGGSDYHGKNKSIPLGKLNAEGEAIPLRQLTLTPPLI